MNHHAKLPRRRYTNEQKQSIVKAALSGEHSKAAIARAHDINANQLTRWIKEYRDGAAWSAQPTRLLPVSVASTEFAVEPGVQGNDWLNGEINVLLSTGHTLRLNDPSRTLLSHLVQMLT